MIFFRVSQNINIKTTDGTLVKYFKFKMPSDLENDTVYITTQDDYLDLKKVFSDIDKNKYTTRLLKEDNVRALENFPKELGIPNKNEYLLYKDYVNSLKDNFVNNKENIDSLFYSTQQVDLFKQFTAKKENSISIAIIGGLGKSISQIIASSTALRIFYKTVKELFKEVKLDIYLDASHNTFYSRDKQIYKKLDFVNAILPLSITSKKLCEYDYFVDTSSIIKKSVFFNKLNYVDSWLYKFGINYKKISSALKHNELTMDKYTPSKTLNDKLKHLKLKGKLLLFHPFSANLNKSIPQHHALAILKKLIEKCPDYTIISTLKIDLKNEDDRFVNLSKESRLFDDFAYIVSNMDAIITVDTSTYHLGDAFMIPTVVISNNNDISEQVKYYDFTKFINLKDESKSLSKFSFPNNDLTLYKFKAWENLKVSRIIKLLDSF
jgi:ADP-heptose:LPS heptosyltransferase